MNPNLKSPPSLSDEEYRLVTIAYEPLWRYVTKNYDKYNYDYDMATPVTVLGYQSLPLAIELSQYGYDVSLLVNDYDELIKAKASCLKLAGEKVKVLNLPWLYNTIKSEVCLTIEVLDTLNDWAMDKFLNMITKAHGDVVTTVNPHFDMSRLEKWLEREQHFEQYTMVRLTRQ